jgi:hypothetical protein
MVSIPLMYWSDKIIVLLLCCIFKIAIAVSTAGAVLGHLYCLDRPPEIDRGAAIILMHHTADADIGAVIIKSTGPTAATTSRLHKCRYTIRESQLRLFRPFRRSGYPDPRCYRGINYSRWPLLVCRAYEAL